MKRLVVWLAVVLCAVACTVLIFLPAMRDEAAPDDKAQAVAMSEAVPVVIPAAAPAPAPTPAAVARPQPRRLRRHPHRRRPRKSSPRHSSLDDSPAVGMPQVVSGAIFMFRNMHL